MIIDSKPRFKAEWLSNGIVAKRSYKGWSRGAYLPGSVRVFNRAKSISEELHNCFRSHRVAIAQTHPGRIADLVWLQSIATSFYGDFNDSQPRLIVVDELADFFEVKKMGGIFWQTARSGRELNIGLLAGSQRPSYIPNVVLTESDRLYLFTLDYSEDMKKVYQMGIPKEIGAPQQEHSFFYWDKFKRFQQPSGKYYKLEV